MSDNIETPLRDKLLNMVSNSICKPCEDERKPLYKLNYENALNCECRCECVDKILEHVKKLNTT